MLPGRGRRGRALLLRPRPRVHHDQRGVHDMTQQPADQNAARRRHAARGAAVHPRVPRPDGRDQVRRRGDDRPDAEGGVRARRGAAQVRRHQPGDRPRRRPRDHLLHGAARPAGEVRRRPAGLRRRDRRAREDGAGRQGQQGHRAAARPPRPAGRRAQRRRRLLFRCSRLAAPERPGHRLRRPDRPRQHRRAHARRRGLHPGDRERRRRRARATPTTSTPTTPPPRWPRRSAPTR